MKNIPSAIEKILSEELLGSFTRPTYARFMNLILGAILTTGSRTVCNIVRTVRSLIPGHVSSYNRVFSKRRWSTTAVARGLARVMVRHLISKGTIHLAADDTVDEHRGVKVFGKDCHRDPVYSSRTFTVFFLGSQMGCVKHGRKIAFLFSSVGAAGSDVALSIEALES